MKTPAQRYIEAQRGGELLNCLISDIESIGCRGGGDVDGEHLLAELRAIRRLLACCDQDEWCQCGKKNDE